MTKSYFIILCLMISHVFSLEGQTEGDKYVIGYYGLGQPDYSVMYLDFSGPEVQIEWHFDDDILLSETTSNVCDLNGNVLLLTNGMQIFGSGGVHITDTIAYFEDMSGYWDYYYSANYGPFGFPEHDGAVILPVPDHQNEYLVLYHACESHPTNFYQITRYLSSRIRYNPDNEIAELIYKDSLIGPHHQWYTGTLNVTRHANGKDWWIIAFEEDSPRYYSFLLDASGISLHHSGEVDAIVKEGLGDAAFSSNGNFLARLDAISTPEGQYITVYSFDRCGGDLIRIATLHQDAGIFAGVSFSPNERYLYGDDNSHLWQWDLWSADIEASQILVDTFDGFVQPGWFGMYFGPMFEAPDGRIYIVPPAGSSEFIHVIDRPNLPGIECRFRQHYINLTKPNGRSSPNLPNYRLGPLDGSSCDTLGIDNIPVARWRFEEDQPGWRYDIRFTDLSFYDPQQWYWDFGDGGTSEEIHPVHSFENGLYNVCLTVSNENGTDSSCQWVEILPTSLENQLDNPVSDLTIDPNPFADRVEIKSKMGTIRTASLEIFDTNGSLVINQPKAPVPVTLYMPQLPPGMYLFRIRDNDGTLYNFKVMKI